MEFQVTFFGAGSVSEQFDAIKKGVDSLTTAQIGPSDYFRFADHPDVIAPGYFGAVEGDSEAGILRPASVYSPKKRIVAIASKETGTHIPFSCPNCIVR